MTELQTFSPAEPSATNDRVNKQELVKRVAKATSKSEREIYKILSAVFGVIEEALVDGERVMVLGFGSFGTRVRKAKIGRNPQTGESLHIPSKRVVTFSAGKGLEDKVEKEE